MTSPQRGLEAPHRRTERGFSRPVERTAVSLYRAVAWALGHLPERPARVAAGWIFQASYLLWPTKRRWSNINFGRVLGRHPGDPAVRRLALAAYRGYGRYIVELMRLPNRPLDEVMALVEAEGVEELGAFWRASGRGVILTLPHVGNLEAAAAGLAHHGFPISGLADDSALPELLELLTRQREAWGIRTIYWRNIRGIFEVLRRGEVLALLVDWGYRSDGIPVRLFGAWTTLPAGPATLAAKAKVPILPVAVHRNAAGRYVFTHGEFIDVADSDPATLQAATQRVADALEADIARAPDQWYSFKPMWPLDPTESEELERRAAAAASPAGGTGDRPGRRRSRRRATRAEAAGTAGDGG